MVNGVQPNVGLKRTGVNTDLVFGAAGEENFTGENFAEKINTSSDVLGATFDASASVGEGASVVEGATRSVEGGGLSARSEEEDHFPSVHPQPAALPDRAVDSRPSQSSQPYGSLPPDYNQDVDMRNTDSTADRQNPIYQLDYRTGMRDKPSSNDIMPPYSLDSDTKHQPIPRDLFGHGQAQERIRNSFDAAQRAADERKHRGWRLSIEIRSVKLTHHQARVWCKYFTPVVEQ